MFKRYRSLVDVVAARAGRVAFGLVLIAGALLLAFHARDFHYGEPSRHAWEYIAGAWGIALAAGIGVTITGSLLPRSRNRGALRTEALAVPAVGISLLLPLTIHLLYLHGESADSFDEWVRMSVMLTSHTHIVLALLVASRAIALAKGEPPVGIPHIYAVTCGVALIPMIIPMFFVAVTGIPFVPLLLWMPRIARIDRERSRDIPFAIARAA